MESVSGKFVSKKVSGFVYEDGENINKKIAAQIPSLPICKNNNPISMFLEDYFGRFWWLWLLLLIVKLYKK